jgi:hypothetical protein
LLFIIHHTLLIHPLDNKIDDSGAQAIAESLKQNHSITNLELECNSIYSKGSAALLSALKDNVFIKKLSMEVENRSKIERALIENAQIVSTALRILTIARVILHAAPGSSISVLNKDLFSEIFRKVAASTLRKHQLDKIIHIAADRTTLKTLTRISFLLQITR